MAKTPRDPEGMPETPRQDADSKRSGPEADLESLRRSVCDALEGWAESSWGKVPPNVAACREQIKACSRRIAVITPKLASAQEAREMAWLALFEMTDGPQDVLRTATDEELSRGQLGLELARNIDRLDGATKELEKLETLVKWWRTELARVEAKKRSYEFWREYSLTKEEAEAFAFRSEFESGRHGYSAADLRGMEERIQKINRSLPPGYKPIPSINPQTIMYVPSSIPGQYLPKYPQLQ
jgi:hypothetical protein